MQRIVILGCGYVGSKFAKLCQREGHHVTVISRETAKVSDLGIADSLIQYDWSDSNVTWRIDPPIDVLLCTVSHRIQFNSAGDRLNVHARCLANVFSGLANAPKRIIYVSTTGVYQSSDSGDWIDESSPCQPDRPGAQNAYDAEQWLAENSSDNSVILRPAGIYGPDRVPNLEALCDGKPIAANPDSYLNLIHVDDLVQIISHLGKVPCIPHSIYNVSDGNPVLRSEYYGFLTKKLGAPAPVFTSQSSVEIRSRGQGSKRIDASRLKQDFSIPWKYPDYKTGLEPLLASYSAASE